MCCHLMRPFPGRFLNERKSIFNYRLSRARRVIENSFGILVSRWRLFRRPICAKPKYVDQLILAAVCLHHFLMAKNETLTEPEKIYCPPTYVDREAEDGTVIPGQWREGNNIVMPERNGAHRATNNAYKMRDNLADYFLTDAGQVPWQYEYVRRGTYGNIV